MARSQILVIIEPEVNKMSVLPFCVINCETDEDLMERLDNLSHLDYEIEVKVLKDDEPWPTLFERLEL